MYFGNHNPRTELDIIDFGQVSKWMTVDLVNKFIILPDGLSIFNTELQGYGLCLPDRFVDAVGYIYFEKKRGLMLELIGTICIEQADTFFFEDDELPELPKFSLTDRQELSFFILKDFWEPYATHTREQFL
ncbi:MAG: hypothetical protein LBM95_09530 [Lactobacillales bacterium]|jgi:hypothetical protein|nr:hypothetical protein [Lactobacillales bacterium]